MQKLRNWNARIADINEVISIIATLKKMLHKYKNEKYLEIKLQLATFNMNLGGFTSGKVSKDADKEAFRLLIELCHSNITENTKKIIARAHIHLGSCFEKGIGVEIDENKAASLYNKAEEMGDQEGTYYFAEMNYRNKKIMMLFLTNLKCLLKTRTFHTLNLNIDWRPAIKKILAFCQTTRILK